MATVIATFDTEKRAEDAVRSMRQQGFREDEISIIARDRGGKGGEVEAGGELGDVNNLSSGTAWGGGLGGVLGLLTGVGALAIPGVGPIVAAGPLAATLSGAVTGGVVGGLIDLGIPEERGQYYESEVKAGKILSVVETDDNRVEEVSNILRDNGANDIEVH